MKPPATAKLSLLLLLASVPTRAQTTQPDTDAVRAGVMEILSLVTLGAVSIDTQATQVTRSGADYQVRLPLRGFAAPADAALQGVVRPAGDGVWDILSLRFPAAGTVPTTGASGQIEYTIGEQSVHARVDPGFIHPSAVTADFVTIRLRSGQDDLHIEQAVGRYVMDATVSAETAGRLNFASQAHGTELRLNARAANDISTDVTIRDLSGHVTVDGLDRVKGARLMAATHAYTESVRNTAQPPVVTGQKRVLSTTEREALRTMVDAATGLLTRFDLTEVAEGIRFSAGPSSSGSGSGGRGSAGSVQRLRLRMSGDTANDQLTTHLDIGLDELAVAGLSAATASYLPHHVDISSVVAGVPAEPLLALMRAATDGNPDAAALRAQAAELFGDPRARIGIESLRFDAGPLRMTGSLRLVRRTDGQVGADIHLSAQGVNTLIANAPGNPVLQQVLPMVFLAKGMGRADGEGIAWDIALGGGPMTVNGVPFGQPSGSNPSGTDPSSAGPSDTDPSPADPSGAGPSGANR